MVLGRVKIDRSNIMIGKAEDGKVWIKYRVTDEKQKALAVGRIHLSSEIQESWRFNTKDECLYLCLDHVLQDRQSAASVDSIAKMIEGILKG